LQVKYAGDDRETLGFRSCGFVAVEMTRRLDFALQSASRIRWRASGRRGYTAGRTSWTIWLFNLKLKWRKNEMAPKHRLHSP
jgi:hypothetical protein